MNDGCFFFKRLEVCVSSYQQPQQQVEINLTLPRLSSALQHGLLMKKKYPRQGLCDGFQVQSSRRLCEDCVHARLVALVVVCTQPIYFERRQGSRYIIAISKPFLIFVFLLVIQNHWYLLFATDCN
jgi:hypothetical protein